jgi:hypothetical protein
LPIADGGLSISDFGLPIADGALSISDFGLQIADGALSISDSRFGIADCGVSRPSLSCRIYGSDSDRQELVGFAHQGPHPFGFHNRRLNQQFHPIEAFVCLLLDGSHF